MRRPLRILRRWRHGGVLWRLLGVIPTLMKPHCQVKVSRAVVRWRHRPVLKCVHFHHLFHFCEALFALDAPYLINLRINTQSAIIRLRVAIDVRRTFWLSLLLNFDNLWLFMCAHNTIELDLLSPSRRCSIGYIFLLERGQVGLAAVGAAVSRIIPADTRSHLLVTV